MLCFPSVYAQQCDLSVKDLFYDQLCTVQKSKHQNSLSLVVIEMATEAAQAQVAKNMEALVLASQSPIFWVRIIEYALAYDLLLHDICFKKRDSHIAYRLGNIATQIDLLF